MLARSMPLFPFGGKISILYDFLLFDYVNGVMIATLPYHRFLSHFPLLTMISINNEPYRFGSLLMMIIVKYDRYEIQSVLIVTLLITVAPAELHFFVMLFL